MTYPEISEEAKQAIRGICVLGFEEMPYFEVRDSDESNTIAAFVDRKKSKEDSFNSICCDAMKTVAVIQKLQKLQELGKRNLTDKVLKEIETLRAYEAMRVKQFVEAAGLEIKEDVKVYFARKSG